MSTKRTNRRNLVVVFMLAGSLLMLGCGDKGGNGGGKVGPPKYERTCPGWVDKGSGFFTGDKGRAFYGVGAASGMADPAMVAHRRNHADMMARNNLAKSLKTHVEGLMKAYSRVIGDEKKTAFEQFSQEVARTITDMDLVGTPVVDRCWEPSEQTQYSLVVMDVQGFVNTVKAQKMGAEAQQIIIDNANAAFGELDSTLAEARGGSK